MVSLVLTTLGQPLFLAGSCGFTPTKGPQVEGKAKHSGCRNNKQPAHVFPLRAGGFEVGPPPVPYLCFVLVTCLCPCPVLERQGSELLSLCVSEARCETGPD